MERVSLSRLEVSMIRAPQLPVVVTQALRLLSEAEPDFEELVRLVSTDPALAGRLISIANSPFMGRRRRANDVRSACVTLGLNAVRSAILSVGLVKQLRSTGTPGMVVTDLWAHSFGAAAAARCVAPLTGADPEMAYTAGLLHDIGKIILIRHCGPAYQAVLAHQQAHDCFITEAEREVLGLDHSLVGHHVGRDWHLPDYLTDTIAHFHRPEQAAYPEVADAVHVGNVLARALELGNPGDDLVPPISPLVAERRRLTAAALADRFADIEAAFEQICEVLD